MTREDIENVSRLGKPTYLSKFSISSWYPAAVYLTVLFGAGAIADPAQQIGVGSQYDTTHVYVDPKDIDAFVKSFVATFGGESTKQVIATVTPTPSSTISHVIRTPAGAISGFAFKTPIPYPFGAERTGYLVADVDDAVKAARSAGADVIVSPFSDAIGRDVVIQWTGGVNMQLYWHTTKSNSPALQSVPENRVYISADRIAAFVDGFLAFSNGKVVSDDPQAPGIEIGRPGTKYRRVRIESVFGKLAAIVSDGHLPYPYGRESTGYEVRDLAATLIKAKEAGARILVEPYMSNGRRAAIVQFPGGYIAEMHSALPE